MSHQYYLNSYQISSLTGNNVCVLITYYQVFLPLIQVAPQGYVLSPVLVITYTNDLRSRFDHWLLIKYADDTIIVRLITNSDDTKDKPQIDDVSQWCQSHDLLLNVAKTKEIILDFRYWDSITHEHLIINNNPLEIRETFNYRGITIDNNLTWSKYCVIVVSKCKQKLFFLYLLNLFCVNSEILSRPRRQKV